MQGTAQPTLTSGCTSVQMRFSGISFWRSGANRLIVVQQGLHDVPVVPEAQS